MELKLYKVHEETKLIHEIGRLCNSTKEVKEIQEAMIKNGATDTTIFSILDDNDGEGCFLSNGIKFVNCIGYYVLPGLYSLGDVGEIIEYREVQENV